jgi:glycosyltransferase involved in cell wall biosynthesis
VSVDFGDPIVSIIIPNYNHAQFVGDAINSVLDQDYRNFEIIVVNDGSTDNSHEVINNFGDQVRYIRQENQGLSAARNTGIKHAKGSYIGVLDADDMYEPAFLSTMMSTLLENPTADGIYCGYQFVDQSNNLLPQIEARAIPSNELYHVLLDGDFLVPESMFVRRYCYDWAGPFDTSLRACEDWDMWLRISKKFRIIHTTQILTRHRILQGSMSTDPERMLNNRLAVLKKHMGAEPIGEKKEAGLRRRAYGRAYLGSCVEYLQAGEQAQAYKCFQRMAIVCPTLLTELDTFYQLGCGEQPKGFMGSFSRLDMDLNSRALIAMLKRLFIEIESPERVKCNQRMAFARAYHALGLLSYGSKQLKFARRFLLQAIKYDNGLLFNKSIIVTFTKSLLGVRILSWLKLENQRLALVWRLIFSVWSV